MEDHLIHEFDNGIRLIYKQALNTKVAHCGFILDIGSRDEGPGQQGLAHFWEHMVFKGTKKRKAFHILNRLDSVGGELNAYTTKEKICFYASVLNNHFDKAVDLLTDITFDSIFPEQQIEREKMVILEEMSMYKDNPEDFIQDDFDDLIFSGHSLGNNILGTQESVNSFGRIDFQRFLKQKLNTEKIVFSVVSSLPFKKVLKIASRYINAIPAIKAKNNRPPFTGYIAKTRITKKPILQAHCGIGNIAYHIHDEQKNAFILLTNLLGGPGMNSRLNLGIREKYGFVYSIDASYNAFTDTGLFSIFFATDAKYLSKCVQLVLKEMNKLKDKELSVIQFQKARDQMIGQVAIAEENNANLMLAMGKSLLDLGRIDTFEEILVKINRLSPGDLLESAREVFKDGDLSFIYIKPSDN